MGRASLDTVSTLSERLAAEINNHGPITVADYMAQANAHYYATRDPFGVAGDFITAPEISQMYGELVGLWLADIWQRIGSPANATYVELGPGRGTLAVDALRAMRSVHWTPSVHFVETSPILRQAQHMRVPDAAWHDRIDSLPDDRPLLIIANEFFDALPIHQYQAAPDGWRELMVKNEGDGFVTCLNSDYATVNIPEELCYQPGGVLEYCPDGLAIMSALSARLAAQGGVMLMIDYGYYGPKIGDTLQAVKAHNHAQIFQHPGEQDITAYVNFAPLADAARDAGLNIYGPTDQGLWLGKLGLAARTAQLSAQAPDRAEELRSAYMRLTDANAMGHIFKVMTVTAPNWPVPEGF